MNKKQNDAHNEGAHGTPFDGEFAGGDGAILEGVILDEREGPTMHRDISDIAVTEIDGITINRTKHKTSPFVPIFKTPTYSENSGTLSGFSVEVEDEESKTGYKHLGNVSKSYLLLSNEEVRELAVEIAMQSGLPFKESRVFWDGARFAHVVDFLETEAVEEGDEVGLSLITRSSYDRTWKYDCALMGKRFLCDNGALSGEFFARVSFKHLTPPKDGHNGDGDEGPKEEAWKEIVRQGMSVIDRAPENLHRFTQGLRLLKGARMTDANLREVWTTFPTIGDAIKGQIMSRYVAHEEPTLYGLFNAGTNVFWHRAKMTSADYANNDAFTTGVLGYAFERLG